MNNGIKISAIDFYVPDKVITNNDLAKIVNTSDEWITQRTGIKQRHIISGEENSAVLGINAAEKVVIKSSIDPMDIDLIIVASSSPHKAFPSIACEIQSALGCKKAVGFDIKAACSGFIYGLSIAKAYILSGMFKNILVVATDATTKFLDWDERGTCVLFGDGAGAALIQKTNDCINDLKFINIVSDGDSKDLISLNIPNQNCPLAKPDIERKKYIQMQGREVYKYVMQKIPNEINRILKEANKTIDDIDYFIPHQANMRMIEALSTRLKISNNKVISNIDKYGNISAASIPTVITEGINTGKILLPCNLLICAFGAGMTIGSGIISLRKDLR